MTHTTIVSLRNNSARLAVVSLVAIGAFVQASTALATPLPVASAILAAPGAGPVGGALLINSGPVAFASATFTGTLTSQVIANDPANPFGPGNLTFTYLLTNIGGPNSIDRLTVGGYGIPGLLTDATYQAPTLGILPTSFDRSSVATLGDVIGTSFTPAPLGSGAIPPAGASALIVIQTNATQFNPSTASVIDGSTAQVSTFAPREFIPTPEPSSIVLGIMGFAGLGAVVRRRMTVK
jgi:PEP-CTERM motif